MVDFRKCIPALAVAAVVLGSALTASAQVAPALSCTSNAGATPLVRVEGLSELVGDIILNCTGGVPTAAGATVPQVNLVVLMNTNITSRLLADPYTEALILIDDPAPANQVPCVPASGFTSCPVTGVYAGQAPGVAGNTGVNFKSGGVPNVFQGRTATSLNGVANAALQWLGVPVDPPGTNGTRTIRITNVRANASTLGTGSSLIPTQIQAFISITPSQALPLNNPQQTVAYIAPGLTFGLRNGDNSGSTSGVTFQQCVSNNPAIAADSSKPLDGLPASSGLNNISFIARFTEGFPSSFKKRNVSGLSGATGTGNADVSPTPLNQDVPGGVQNTETGFYNANYTTTNGLNRAGLADSGTRLMLRFAGVPLGITQIFVGVYQNGTNATTSKVRLISTDANGAGAFTTISATNTLYAPVAITAGSGVAVYEVMWSDPLAGESIDVPVAVSYVANTTTSTPGLGQATVSGSFAPLSNAGTQVVASNTGWIPRFVTPDVANTKAAFQITACSTNLLFPFVTNQAGFDTGIAIANTSLDPFKTATQEGACVINYYGNTTGGGVAPAAAPSSVVKAGTELVFSIGNGGGGVPAAPGFQGYIIAQCNFQYAHGFAFVSDIGAQKLAEGYLALVLDAPLSTARSKTNSETLNQ